MSYTFSPTASRDYINHHSTCLGNRLRWALLNSVHNFVGHLYEYIPTAGAEYLVNDRFGLAGSNPAPPAPNVSGGSCPHLVGSFCLEVVMANKTLFASLKSLLPRAAVRNEAGGWA